MGNVALTCRCGRTILKIARPSGECELGDQFRALDRVRGLRCFEQLAESPNNVAPVPHTATTVVARRVLRVHEAAGVQITDGACHTYGPTQRALLERQASCDRVRGLLEVGAARLAGHDSEARNFIWPSEPDGESLRWGGSVYAGCPVVLIDLSEYAWTRPSTATIADGQVSPFSYPHVLRNPWFPRPGAARRRGPHQLLSWQHPSCLFLQQVLRCNISEDTCRGTRPPRCRKQARGAWRGKA